MGGSQKAKQGMDLAEGAAQAEEKRVEEQQEEKPGDTTAEGGRESKQTPQSYKRQGENKCLFFSLFAV